MFKKIARYFYEKNVIYNLRSKIILSIGDIFIIMKTPFFIYLTLTTTIPLTTGIPLWMPEILRILSCLSMICAFLWAIKKIRKNWN